MPLIAGASMVTPDGMVDDGWIHTEGETIVAVGVGQPPRPPDRYGRWVLPGFVDLHSHGGGRATVVGADPDQVRTFADIHRRHGTTSIVASLVSADIADLEHDVAGLAELAASGVIAGIHLEGPWISPAKKGAHDERALCLPEPSAVRRLLFAGRGHLRMVTLAPELEHGLEAVRMVVDGGAVAAVGHTNASYEVTCQAIDAGATVASHLFNAMEGIHHRRPGPVVALLADDRVTVELVLDGVHLHPAIAAHVLASTGAGRIALVTDAVPAAGAGDGDYRLGELPVQVRGGVATLGPGGPIAGSTLTMDRAFRYAVQRGGFSAVEAVRAASTNPARLLGLDDRTGALAAGLAADVVVLDDDLRLEGVLARGSWVR